MISSTSAIDDPAEAVPKRVAKARRYLKRFIVIEGWKMFFELLAALFLRPQAEEQDTLFI